MIKNIISHTSSSIVNNVVPYDVIRKRHRLKYLKHYRTKRKYSVKEIKVTVPISDYNILKKEALKYWITVNKLLLNFSKAYQSKSYIVPIDINTKLQQLIFIFRNIANNINQIAKHSNTFKFLISSNKLLTNLKTLELEVRKFIEQPTLNKDDYKKH